jgi:AcrR family transcriptional regulator
MPLARRKDSFRPRKQAIQTRSRRTVEAILKAAAQVFAQRGYAGGTTNHVAERAGVSIGTLYEYFPSKDALLVSLIEAHLREGEAIVERAASEVAAEPSDLRQTVRRFIRAMVDLHARDRALHRVLFEEAPLPQHVRRMYTEVEKRITERVEALLRQHREVVVQSPALAAAIVVQAVEGLTHKLVIYGVGDTSLDDFVEEIVSLLTSYLTTQPPSLARPK